MSPKSRFIAVENKTPSTSSRLVDKHVIICIMVSDRFFWYHYVDRFYGVLFWSTAHICDNTLYVDKEKERGTAAMPPTTHRDSHSPRLLILLPTHSYNSRTYPPRTQQYLQQALNKLIFAYPTQPLLRLRLLHRIQGVGPPRCSYWTGQENRLRIAARAGVLRHP